MLHFKAQVNTNVSLIILEKMLKLCALPYMDVVTIWTFVYMFDKYQKVMK